jgi:hypothetical protein
MTGHTQRQCSSSYPQPGTAIPVLPANTIYTQAPPMRSPSSGLGPGSSPSSSPSPIVASTLNSEGIPSPSTPAPAAPAAAAAARALPEAVRGVARPRGLLLGRLPPGVPPWGVGMPSPAGRLERLFSNHSVSCVEAWRGMGGDREQQQMLSGCAGGGMGKVIHEQQVLP